jgi:hypothetical protein
LKPQQKPSACHCQRQIAALSEIQGVSAENLGKLRRKISGEVQLNKAIIGAAAAFCLAAVPFSAMAEDHKFDLVNNSARAIANFYTSPADATDWQEDVLGEDTIPPGATDTIAISTDGDQCLYDMRFIMEDNAELIEKGINVCTLGSYTLSDAK